MGSTSEAMAGSAETECHHGWRGSAIREQISSRCPSCGGQLFIGSGGHITCSNLGCKDPCAAYDLLDAARQPAAPAPVDESGLRERARKILATIPRDRSAMQQENLIRDLLAEVQRLKALRCPKCLCLVCS